MTISELIAWLLPELSQTMQHLALDLSVFGALATCFFGFRLRKVCLSLLGALVGGGLSWAITGALQLELSGGMRLLICIGAALVVALLAWKLFQAGSFVLVFLFVSMAASDLLAQLGVPFALVLAALAGIGTALLAVRWEAGILIVVTAASGGWRAASGIMQRFDLPLTLYWTALILIGGGLIFQLVQNREYLPRRRKRRNR